MSKNFMSAMTRNDTRTTNGMVSNSTSDNYLIDFFFASGASRDKDLTNLFAKAWATDPTLASKALFYCRDIRGGQGEKATFKNLVKFIAQNEEMAKMFERNIQFIPQFGSWNDVVELIGTRFEQAALETIRNGLANKDGLCGKWMPRKGKESLKIRDFLDLTPKKYRQLIVGLSKTVEQKMCSKQWKSINYSHVPSKAAKLYSKAFMRHDKEGYSNYISLLKSDSKEVKVNAAAIHPHEILFRNIGPLTEQQWKALPDFMAGSENNSILPVCDVSGSMSGLPMQVCVSLGLYVAERNRGAFKDVVVTFHDNPSFFNLNQKSALDRKAELMRAPWGGTTNLEKTFQIILDRAKQSSVPVEDMPNIILIMSDMQFNSCTKYPNLNAFQMIKKQYEESGYKMPSVVFWNLNTYEKTLPVKVNEQGVALVSGFSPSIMKSILNGEITPMSMFNRTVGKNERYANIYVS